MISMSLLPRAGRILGAKTCGKIVICLVHFDKYFQKIAMVDSIRGCSPN